VTREELGNIPRPAATDKLTAGWLDTVNKPNKLKATATASAAAEVPASPMIAGIYNDGVGTSWYSSSARFSCTAGLSHGRSTVTGVWSAYICMGRGKRCQFTAAFSHGRRSGSREMSLGS